MHCCLGFDSIQNSIRIPSLGCNTLVTNVNTNRSVVFLRVRALIADSLKGFYDFIVYNVRLPNLNCFRHFYFIVRLLYDNIMTALLKIYQVESLHILNKLASPLKDKKEGIRTKQKHAPVFPINVLPCTSSNPITCESTNQATLLMHVF
jgi:hypothetical protein